MAAELARHCVMENQQQGTVNLTLHISGEQLHTDATEKQLCDALESYYSRSIRLDIALQKQSNDANQVNQIETPAQKAQREGEERQQQAEQEIYNDPFVKLLQEQFDARIVKGSIKPRT